MPIENSKDKNILNLLDNNAPLKAIKVDFLEGNNLNLVIKYGFTEAYKNIENLKKENFYYIIKLNQIMNCIDVVGLVQMKIEKKDLIISWLETNKVFKNKGYSKEIINYLVRYAEYLHLDKIISNKESKIWKVNNFTKVQNTWVRKLWN